MLIEIYNTREGHKKLCDSQLELALFGLKSNSKMYVCQKSADDKMSTKKMLNNVDSSVDEMLLGTVLSNPNLVKMENHRVVLRSGKRALRNDVMKKLLCISTSFQVLAAPESWSIYFFSAVFNLF